MVWWWRGMALRLTIDVAWRFVDGLFVEDRDWWLIYPTTNS